MKWTVDWEAWNFDAGKIESIIWLPGFTIEAASLGEAEQIGEKEFPEMIRLRRQECPEDFGCSGNSIGHILGLKDENGQYHELFKHRTVFHGQVTEMPDYGSFE